MYAAQVEISSTTWRDWDTGQETDFTGVNCTAFYYGGVDTATTYSACVLGGGSGDTIASSANATEGCKNALSSVCYTVSLFGHTNSRFARVAPLRLAWRVCGLSFHCVAFFF